MTDFNLLPKIGFLVLIIAFGTYQSHAEETAAQPVALDVQQDNVKQDDGDVNADNPTTEPTVEKVNPEKRFISSSILGKGLLGGKRMSREMSEKDKRYGMVLGSGFSFGKRVPEFQGDVMTDDQFDADYVKRWLGDVYGGGYNLYRRSKRDTGDKRFIRYFGNVLGGGFSVGKRDGATLGENVNLPGDVFIPDDMYYMIPVDDEGMKRSDEGNEGDSDGIDKRYVDSAPGYRFMFGKREPSDDKDNDKRYFNSDVGGRFNFGKRYDDEAGDIDKRYGFVLGRGFSFGKRNQAKRYFGHVLGNGFALGKRAGDFDEDSDVAGGLPPVFVVPAGFDNTAPESGDNDGWKLEQGFTTDKRGNKRYGWLLGKGLAFGKRSNDANELPMDEGYFIDSDGNVEVPDKRFAMTQAYKLAGKDPKRYGYVLGRGFSFGKRSQSGDEGDSTDGSMSMDKRYGFLLGRGFSFGKRRPSHRAYGSILGQGFSFGKRSDEPTPLKEELKV